MLAVISAVASWQKSGALGFGCREAGPAENTNEQRDERCPGYQRVDPIFHRIGERVQKLSPGRNAPFFVFVAE